MITIKFKDGFKFSHLGDSILSGKGHFDIYYDNKIIASYAWGQIERVEME